MPITASLDWLNTLADKTRVRLLRLLEEQELSVSELCVIVQLPQSTVSRHLKVLTGDEWVMHRREGTTHLYHVESGEWCEARSSLWDWVRSQAESPSTMLDGQRLAQIVANRSRSEAFFSSTAEQWDRLRIDLFGKQFDAHILAASLPSDVCVGELGCGSAPLTSLIAPYVREVIAVDNSAAMISEAKHRLRGLSNVRVIQSSLTELAIEDSVLDHAWLIVVLPYLATPIEVLSEARRAMKAGATLTIVDLLPHDRKNYRQEMGHVRLGTSRDELESWLDESGLRLERYHPLPPDPDAKGPAMFAAVTRAI